MSGEEPERLCPSSPAREGTILLGIGIGRRGLGYVTPQVTVDQAFLEEAGERPEERYRFAAPCVKKACHNWDSGGCGLISRFVADPPPEAAEDGPLPRCSIRANCRWFAQAGRTACAVCPMVRNPGPTTRD
jgi:hypothetical protein